MRMHLEASRCYRCKTARTSVANEVHLVTYLAGPPALFAWMQAPLLEEHGAVQSLLDVDAEDSAPVDVWVDSTFVRPDSIERGPRQRVQSPIAATPWATDDDVPLRPRYAAVLPDDVARARERRSEIANALQQKLANETASRKLREYQVARRTRVDEDAPQRPRLALADANAPEPTAVPTIADARSLELKQRFADEEASQQLQQCQQALLLRGQKTHLRRYSSLSDEERAEFEQQELVTAQDLTRPSGFKCRPSLGASRPLEWHQANAAAAAASSAPPPPPPIGRTSLVDSEWRTTEFERYVESGFAVRAMAALPDDESSRQPPPLPSGQRQQPQQQQRHKWHGAALTPAAPHGAQRSRPSPRLASRSLTHAASVGDEGKGEAAAAPAPQLEVAPVVAQPKPIAARRGRGGGKPSLSLAERASQPEDVDPPSTPPGSPSAPAGAPAGTSMSCSARPEMPISSVQISSGPVVGDLMAAMDGDGGDRSPDDGEGGGGGGGDGGNASGGHVVWLAAEARPAPAAIAGTARAFHGAPSGSVGTSGALGDSPRVWRVPGRAATPRGVNGRCDYPPSAGCTSCRTRTDAAASSPAKGAPPVLKRPSGAGQTDASSPPPSATPVAQACVPSSSRSSRRKEHRRAAVLSMYGGGCSSGMSAGKANDGSPARRAPRLEGAAERTPAYDTPLCQEARWQRGQHWRRARHSPHADELSHELSQPMAVAHGEGGGSGGTSVRTERDEAPPRALPRLEGGLRARERGAPSELPAAAEDGMDGEAQAGEGGKGDSSLATHHIYRSVSEHSQPLVSVHGAMRRYEARRARQTVRPAVSEPRAGGPHGGGGGEAGMAKKGGVGAGCGGEGCRLPRCEAEVEQADAKVDVEAEGGEDDVIPAGRADPVDLHDPEGSSYMALIRAVMGGGAAANGRGRYSRVELSRRLDDAVQQRETLVRYIRGRVLTLSQAEQRSGRHAGYSKVIDKMATAIKRELTVLLAATRTATLELVELLAQVRRAHAVHHMPVSAHGLICLPSSPLVTAPAPSRRSSAPIGSPLAFLIWLASRRLHSGTITLSSRHPPPPDHTTSWAACRPSRWRTPTLQRAARGRGTALTISPRCPTTSPSSAARHCSRRGLASP